MKIYRLPVSPFLFWIGLPVCLFSIGLMGLLFPFSREITISLLPLALLFSVWLAFFTSRDKPQLARVLLACWVLAFAIEAFNTASSAVFGPYSYGHGLGIKLLETPVLLGAHWFLLVYGSYEIVRYLPATPLVRLLLAALGCTVFYTFLEIVAPTLDLWQVNADISWKHTGFRYGTFLVLLALFHRLAGRCNNPVMAALALVQALFLCILVLGL